METVCLCSSLPLLELDIDCMSGGGVGKGLSSLGDELAFLINIPFHRIVL